MVSSPKLVAPIIVDANESDFDDDPMPVTYSSDHDWEKHSTFDIENLFGTNPENDDANNYNHPHETCHSFGRITQNHPINIQLVYHVRVLYDDPTPIVINTSF